jgi:hypothetical protein
MRMPTARYTLRAGQSLRSAASLLGITPLRLMEYNPYLDPTALCAGQSILIPPAPRAMLWPFTAWLLKRRTQATGPPA